MAQLTIAPAFQYWMRGIFFNYRCSHSIYENPNFNNEEWNSTEQWFVAVQLSPKWFDYEFNFEFEGHEMSFITILGVRFSKGYTWHAEPMKDSK